MLFEGRTDVFPRRRPDGRTLAMYGVGLLVVLGLGLLFVQIAWRGSPLTRSQSTEPERFLPELAQRIRITPDGTRAFYKYVGDVSSEGGQLYASGLDMAKPVAFTTVAAADTWDVTADGRYIVVNGSPTQVYDARSLAFVTSDPSVASSAVDVDPVRTRDEATGREVFADTKRASRWLDELDVRLGSAEPRTVWRSPYADSFGIDRVIWVGGPEGQVLAGLYTDRLDDYEVRLVSLRDGSSKVVHAARAYFDDWDYDRVGRRILISDEHRTHLVPVPVSTR
jgi:hypothetical protein